MALLALLGLLGFVHTAEVFGVHRPIYFLAAYGPHLLLRLRGSSGVVLDTSLGGVDVQAKPARVGSSFSGLLWGASAGAVTLVLRGKRSHPHGGKSARAAVSVGDPIPAVSLDDGFPAPKSFPLQEFCKGKKVVLVGLPGAFTGT